MPVQKINIGAAPNDKTGDSLREAFALTNAAIDQVNANTEGIAGKVDKAAGMGLSQNSFTNEQRDKLNGLEGSHWRGTFLSVSALHAALPTANAGDYADVDTGVGSDVQRYIWDVSDAKWVQQGAATTITAAQVKALYESNPNTNAFPDASASKLAEIEPGATANQADEYLLNRANHTGTQAMETVDGLPDALEALEAGAGKAVQQTSATGAALLPEGADSQRPVSGSLPAGALLIRGNTQAPADYKLEFWDRAAAAWKALADRTWFGQQIAAAVAEVKDWVNQQIGFTIIYPNGGSATAPANVAINSRYVMPNPFPGFQVLCIAEIQVGGVWGESGWAYSSSAAGGYGVQASQSSTEGIVARTGSLSVGSTGADTGGTFTIATAIVTPVPCRIKVWKLKGAI